MKPTSPLAAELHRFAQQQGITIALFDALVSTNDTARDACYRQGDVVVAERQSGGRGQRGNRWESAAGANIMASWVLTPDFLGAERQFYLVKVAALAVSDALRAIDLEATIKWPNDIYIGTRKVAGILIENDLMGPCIGRSIVGIGLNVNQLEFDPALPNPTSVARELAQGTAQGTAQGKAQGKARPAVQIDRATLFISLYQHLSARYTALSQNHIAALDADYWQRLYLRETPHTFIDGLTRTPFRGMICGVRPTGELEIAPLPEGVTRSYLFKEVEYTVCEK